MKSYDEITTDLLKRRDGYVTERKKRMKKVIEGAILACCFTAVIGLCVWNAARLSNAPTAPQNNEGLYAAGVENGSNDTFCGEYHEIENSAETKLDHGVVYSASSTAPDASHDTSSAACDNGKNTAGDTDKNDTFCGDYSVINGNSSTSTDNMSASSTAVDDGASDEPIITTTVPTIIDDDVLGMIVLDGEKYLQFATGTEAEAYTLDVCLGSAEDFEGTYQTYLKDAAAKVYTVEEDTDILIIKLGNGGTVALRKE